MEAGGQGLGVAVQQTKELCLLPCAVTATLQRLPACRLRTNALNVDAHSVAHCCSPLCDVATTTTRRAILVCLQVRNPWYMDAHSGPLAAALFLFVDMKQHCIACLPAGQEDMFYVPLAVQQTKKAFMVSEQDRNACLHCRSRTHGLMWTHTAAYCCSTTA